MTCGSKVEKEKEEKKKEKKKKNQSKLNFNFPARKQTLFFVAVMSRQLRETKGRTEARLRVWCPKKGAAGEEGCSPFATGKKIEKKKKKKTKGLHKESLCLLCAYHRKDLPYYLVGRGSYPIYSCHLLSKAEPRENKKTINKNKSKTCFGIGLSRCSL
jgi:hypothetical protein